VSLGLLLFAAGAVFYANGNGIMNLARDARTDWRQYFRSTPYEVEGVVGEFSAAESQIAHISRATATQIRIAGQDLRRMPSEGPAEVRRIFSVRMSSSDFELAGAGALLIFLIVYRARRVKYGS
jgi:hypothetical protein